jgi:hypothetical protein
VRGLFEKTFYHELCFFFFSKKNNVVTQLPPGRSTDHLISQPARNKNMQQYLKGRLKTLEQPDQVKGVFLVESCFGCSSLFVLWK